MGRVVVFDIIKNRYKNITAYRDVEGELLLTLFTPWNGFLMTVLLKVSFLFPSSCGGETLTAREITEYTRNRWLHTLEIYTVRARIAQWYRAWLLPRWSGGSSPGRGWEFFSLPPRTNWLWGQPRRLSGSFPGGKAAGARSWPLISI
jgi:hypothetical protein